MPLRGSRVYLEFDAEARELRLLYEDGTPTKVGYFADRDKAGAFIRTRRWHLIPEPKRPEAPAQPQEAPHGSTQLALDAPGN